MTDESEAGENVRPALTFTEELSVKVSDGRTDGCSGTENVFRTVF